MQCPSPMSIPVHKRQQNSARISVPCGRCAVCLSRRREEWTIRLTEEAKEHLNAVFVTLTYDDKNEPWMYKDYFMSMLPFYKAIVKDDFSSRVPAVNKKDVQDFLKRLRHNVPKISYYCVAEYGTKTRRPHYHLIIFGISFAYEKTILEAWGKGQIMVGTVTLQSIKYVCKYHINKTDFPKGSVKPFCLMSKKPAIGSKYVAKMKDYHKDYINNTFYSDNQFKKPLPRYYKDKLLGPTEKKLLSIELEKKNDEKEAERIKQFNNKFPNNNFFVHDQTLKVNHQKKFHEKSNYNNKI